MESKPAAVDVKDGRIIRIRPLHYDWKYRPEQFKPWKIEARGKSFEPTMKTLLDPLALAYKKRVYSAYRILHPLKRVDFDPEGERHVENRGKSGFVEISWDEALDIIESEIRRVTRQYGPYAITLPMGRTRRDQVRAWSPWRAKRPAPTVGRLHRSKRRNPDSWEGWYWGAKHVWGRNRSDRDASVI